MGAEYGAGRMLQVVGAAKAMPADKYSFATTQCVFAPGQKTQFNTVRTFAAQATQLGAGELLLFRYWYQEQVNEKATFQTPR